MPLVLCASVLLLLVSGHVLGSAARKGSARQGKFVRLAAWFLVLAAAAWGDWLSAGRPPLLRMVVICLLLLAAMKGLVYSEWCREGRRLHWKRYFIFSLAWFGMNPACFARRRKNLTWKRDVRIGLACMVAGTAGAWLVWIMGWRQVLLMFVPISLGFHFGALRVLKGVQRATGFPVRTLFPNPLALRGFGDFWARRWNVGYALMMQRVAGRPLGKILGAEAGNFAVFLLSGLLHEMAITLPVGAGYGLPTLYFAGHGVMVWAEKKFAWRGWWRPWLAGFGVVAFLGLLFPAAFQAEVFVPCLRVFEIL